MSEYTPQEQATKDWLICLRKTFAAELEDLQAAIAQQVKPLRVKITSSAASLFGPWRYKDSTEKIIETIQPQLHITFGGVCGEFELYYDGTVSIAEPDGEVFVERKDWVEPCRLPGVLKAVAEFLSCRAGVYENLRKEVNDQLSQRRKFPK